MINTTQLTERQLLLRILKSVEHIQGFLGHIESLLLEEFEEPETDAFDPEPDKE